MKRYLIPFAEPDGALRAVDALLREPRDGEHTVHLAAVVEPLRPALDVETARGARNEGSALRDIFTPVREDYQERWEAGAP